MNTTSRSICLSMVMTLLPLSIKEVMPHDPKPLNRSVHNDIIVEPLPLNSTEGSRYPFITRGADNQIYTCWMEPGSENSFRLRFSAYINDAFHNARTIAQGTDWFVNWADFPSITALSDGTLAAHWLTRNGKGPYAYGIRISCSTDEGNSWTPSFWLHDDQSACEHGFVSILPDDNGRFLAIWLDGRTMEKTNNTQLRMRQFDANGIRDKEVLLDSRVCSCCQTDMTRIGKNVLAVYRDRSPSEIRDISSITWNGTAWAPPLNLHDDSWKIPG